MVELLANVRTRGGRPLFLGVGGSGANAYRALSDLSKDSRDPMLRARQYLRVYCENERRSMGGSPLSNR